MDFLRPGRYDPNNPRTRGYKPIHVAAHIGNNAQIERLVSSGTSVDAEATPVLDNRTTYPLLVALEMRHASTIVLLLDLGANPYKPFIPTRPFGGSGRKLTIKSDNFCFVHAFFDVARQPNPKRGFDHTECLSIFKKLQERGIFIHGANFSECLRLNNFHLGGGGEELLEFYLEQGANPDTLYAYRDKRATYKTWHAPVLQKYLNYPSIITLLRSYGADITKLVDHGHRSRGTVRQYVLGISQSDVIDHDSKKNEALRVQDPEATIKALTDPVELKFPRSSGGSDSNSPEMSSMRAKIERLESQLLACGQSLETCESEKASMRSELSSLEDDMSNISETLTRARGESREKDRTIDGLNRAKTSMQQTINDLRTAVNDGLLTTNRLRAEIERLKEEIRILRGVAPSSGERERERPRQAPVPDPEPSSGFECKYPFNRATATRRQRIASCVPAQGGVFDNVRTATGGRYTHKQKCIEECFIP